MSALVNKYFFIKRRIAITGEEIEKPIFLMADNYSEKITTDRLRIKGGLFKFLRRR